MLQEQGFSAGDLVRRKADQVVAKIQGAQGDSVLLSIEDGLVSGQASVTIKSFLRGEWQKFTAPKEQEQELVEHWNHSALKSTDFAVLILKSKILLSLHEQAAKHQATLQHLKLMLKPTKGVCSTRSFAKHKLVLVPTTTRVDVKQESCGKPQGGVALGFLAPLGSC